MIFGAALLGPECRHGLSGERSSWLLFVVGLELPVPTVSVLPVSSVQRCSTAGVLVSAASSSDRSFSMCWPRCQTRGTHAVGGIR
ncbi:transposase for IS2404 [Mycobacterium liflandii 128FXT]|uniref:Transposase for IS2404 n=1 Tax=Mycobacterium liflandii (strain 128FXT) TaxID=459424 RepID=L7VAS1_MYCL1|nr:transposase for IS2404 [Mycobacterium liflandii 128FXT]